jgi:hypothetical protein
MKYFIVMIFTLLISNTTYGLSKVTSRRVPLKATSSATRRSFLNRFPKLRPDAQTTSPLKSQQILEISKSDASHYTKSPSKIRTWLEEKLRQLWHGKTAEDIIHEIESSSPQAAQSFRTFIKDKKNTQEKIDTLLDLLILLDRLIVVQKREDSAKVTFKVQETNHLTEIHFLAQFIGILCMEKIPDRAILEKLIHWVSDHYMQLLDKKIPTDVLEDLDEQAIPDMLAYLIGFDEKEILITKILDNLDTVFNTPNGPLFMQELRSIGTCLAKGKDPFGKDFGNTQKRAGERMLNNYEKIKAKQAMIQQAKNQQQVIE